MLNDVLKNGRELPTTDSLRVTVVLFEKSWGTISSIKRCRQLSKCLMLRIHKNSRSLSHKEKLKIEKWIKFLKVINLKKSILRPFKTNFQKSHLIWRYRFYKRCQGANTFSARKHTPESDFLFSQTNVLSFHKF